MWPGCSHSQERAHPAVRHRCDNVTSLPVVHRASGIQINTVDPQDPAELIIVDGPAQRQQSLYHNVASSGLQHPEPRDSVRTNSSLHFTAQCSSANKNTGRHCLHDGGQDEERVGQTLSPYSQMGSCVNNNAALQQKHVGCAFSVGTSSVAPQRKTLGVTVQTFTLGCQGFSGARKQTSSPLLRASMKGHFQQEKSSLGALSCEPVEGQHRVHSRTTHYQLQSPRPSPVQELKPLTDVEIHDFIAKEVKQYRRTQSTDNLPTSSDKETQEYAEVQCVSVAALGQARPSHSPTGCKVNEFTQTSACLAAPSENHATEYLQLHRTVAATCTNNEARSPVHIRPGMTLDKLTEKEPCNKRQEEYTSLGLNSNRNLEELYNVTGVTWSPKHMAVKEEGDVRLNPVHNVGWTVGMDNLQGVTNVSVDLQTTQSSIITGNQLVGLSSLSENEDTFPNRRKTSEDRHCHITDQEVVEHSMVTSSLDQIQIHNVMSISTDQLKLLWNKTSHQYVNEDTGPVHPQADLSAEATDKSASVQKLPRLPESRSVENAVNILKDPKYEDISDYEDVSQGKTKLSNVQREKCAENPRYEDISEDEDPVETLAQEISFPEFNKKQSLFERESCGHVQGPPPVKIGSSSDEKLILLDTAGLCTCPRLVETDDGFEHVCPKSYSRRRPGVQTNHSGSCSPSRDHFKDGDSDDQMDDFIVLPISVTNVIFEPEKEIQDPPENIVRDDKESGDEDGHGDVIPTNCPAPKPVTASGSYKMEVFDTVKSFIQAKAVQFGHSFELAPGRSTPEHEMVLEGDAHTPDNRGRFHSEPEDSGETDRCGYLAPLPPETDDYASDKESEQNEATDAQKAQASSVCVQPKTIRQTYSKEQEIIIVDSDTEDESDQNYREKAKRVRLLSSGSVDYGDDPWAQQRGNPPETVDTLYPAAKETADLPVPQHLELLPSTATSRQHFGNKAGHKHVQQETDGKSPKNVILLESDTEDDSDQTHRQENSGRLSSSGFRSSAILSCSKQKRHSPEIEDSENGPTKEEHQEMTSPSAGRTFFVKSGGQSNEAGSEHVQCKSTSKSVDVVRESQKMAKTDDHISKKAPERKPPSVGTAKTLSRKTILLSDKSREARLQSVDKKAGASLADRPESVHRNPKPSKERVDGRGKDERPNIPTGSSRKKHSYERNTMNKGPVTIIEPRPISRQLSLPNPERLSATTMDALRSSYESRRRARPGPSPSDRAPKQRRHSQDSVTPLMRKTRSEAIHLTKARNRDVQREQGSSVGVGYKWFESERKGQG